MWFLVHHRPIDTPVVHHRQLDQVNSDLLGPNPNVLLSLQYVAQYPCVFLDQHLSGSDRPD